MSTIPIARLLANAAARLCGRHGAVSRQAQAQGCSRQTVYRHAAQVCRAILEHAQSPPREQLLRDNQDLRHENRRLWEWLDQAVEFPPSRRQEFAVRAAAMGLSLDQIVELLAVVLGAAAAPSRSTVHRWVLAAAGVAGRLLGRLDQACEVLVETACLDEIFFHGRPVLVGVEPRSMTLIVASKARRLDRDHWLEALAPWGALRYVVADAGKVLQAALKALEARRRAAGATLQWSLDVFHTSREARRVLKVLWNRAKRAWNRAEQADRALSRDRRQGKSTRRATCTARAAWARVGPAMEPYDRARTPWQGLKPAMELFRPDGRLNDRAWAEAQVRRALPGLVGTAWGTLRWLLQHPRAFGFLDRLHQRLGELGISAELRDALTRLWWLRRKARRAAAEDGHDAAAALVQRVVCQKLDPDWPRHYRRVAEVLETAVRASSAVECVNSVLRMHQSRHRNLNQGLLDLKRLYWNTRRFRQGRRRHRCPYQWLGLELPTYDFWDLLAREMEQPSLPAAASPT